MSNVQPIIKWAGGKRKLAPLVSNIAKEDLSNCDTYIEPFLVVVLYILTSITTNFSKMHM